MREAEMEETPGGRRPAGPGWFVVNVADAHGIRDPGAGIYARFENRDAAPFEDFGINVHVLPPGEPSTLYHAEPVQEDFLVLDGDVLAIVEEEERLLRRWDFVHCPAGTRHAFAGAGERGRTRPRAPPPPPPRAGARSASRPACPGRGRSQSARSPRPVTSTPPSRPSHPAIASSRSRRRSPVSGGAWSSACADCTRSTPARRSALRSTRATRRSPSRNGST